MSKAKSCLEPIPGMTDESNESYHADVEFLSHSSLDDFIESIPRYHGLYVAKTIERGPATPAMTLGTALHCLVLTPECVKDQLAVEPIADGRTKEGKEIKAAFAQESVGKTIVPAEQWKVAQAMAESILAHPEAKDILALPGYCEKSIRVEVPLSDGEGYDLVPRGKFKARPDKIFPAGHLVDVKTSRHMDPQAIGRDFYNLGYHRQAAFYEMVRDIAMGQGGGIFWYIVVCSVEPYEVMVFDLDPMAKDLGRRQNLAAINELNDRRKANDWSGRWKGIQRLELPAWAYKG